MICAKRKASQRRCLRPAPAAAAHPRRQRVPGRHGGGPGMRRVPLLRILQTSACEKNCYDRPFRLLVATCDAPH